VDYDFTFSDLDGREPGLTGTLMFKDIIGFTEDHFYDSVDGTPFDAVQVLELQHGLTDLVPIQRIFTTIPC